MYVGEVAKILRASDAKVFYDEYEQASLWGKDLYQHLDWVYRRAARYCVIFVSADYARKVWTSHEARSAQARALREGYEYILPARFDDTEIPGLRDTVAFIDLRTTTHSELAALILAKLNNVEYSPAENNRFLAVPQDTKDRDELLRVRPPAWEFLLFGGILKQGIQEHDGAWRDHRAGYAPQTTTYASEAEADRFLTNRMTDLVSIIENLDRLISSISVEEIFGPPGVPGDAGGIEHFASRIVNSYKEMLDWTSSVRGAAVPVLLKHKRELVAHFTDSSIRDIRILIEKIVHDVEEYAQLCGAGSTDPYVMDWSLILKEDKNLIAAVVKESARVARSISS